MITVLCSLRRPPYGLLRRFSSDSVVQSKPAAVQTAAVHSNTPAVVQTAVVPSQNDVLQSTTATQISASEFRPRVRAVEYYVKGGHRRKGPMSAISDDDGLPVIVGDEDAPLIKKSPHFGGVVNWYPGHMAKGLTTMKLRLKKCSAVIEVRDARVPFSSANHLLDEMIGQKKKLIIFNKTDLADPIAVQFLKRKFLRAGENVLFTDFTSGSSASDVIDATCVLLSLERGVGQQRIHSIMVCGMPNVGKSTLLNKLRLVAMDRGGQAAKVGAQPGVTRKVARVLQVSRKPELYMLDTPGVMVPSFLDQDDGLKLALSGGIKDSQIGEDVLAGFLLHTLNRLHAFKYVKLLGLEKPSSNIDFVLSTFAKKRAMLLKGGALNLHMAAVQFVLMYRQGKLGRLTLDNVRLRLKRRRRRSLSSTASPLSLDDDEEDEDDELSLPSDARSSLPRPVRQDVQAVASLPSPEMPLPLPVQQPEHPLPLPASRASLPLYETDDQTVCPLPSSLHLSPQTASPDVPPAPRNPHEDHSEPTSH